MKMFIATALLAGTTMFAQTNSTPASTTTSTATTNTARDKKEHVKKEHVKAHKGSKTEKTAPVAADSAKK
jgi:hypothetical protein